MQNRNITMTEGPLLGNILRYTFPIILTGLLQLLFNAADLVVVGQFCGSNSVGAVGATSSLTHLIVNLFIGLSVGAGVSAAQAIGSGREEEIHRTVHTAVPLALVSGVVLTLVGIPLAPLMLQWMGTPTEYVHLSALYMQVYFAGMVPMMVYNFVAAILRAAGDTRNPMVHLTLAGAVNVVLNVLFVTLFQMDVAGVALATSLSQVLAAALELRTLCRRPDACRLLWRQMRFYRVPLLRIVRIGIPAGIQSSLFSISNVIIQSTINSFGPLVGSGNAAGSSVEGFSYTIMNAFSQAAMNFTGQNVGAHNYPRVRKIMTSCLLCVTGCGLLFGSLTYFGAEPLLGLYLSDSAEAVQYGVTRLAYLCLFHFLCGQMEVTSGVIRGMGVSVTPMVLTVLSVCVFRLCWLWWIFPPLGGELGDLFVSYPISWGLNILSLLAVYVVVIRRRLRMEKAAL